jgi:5-methyltetrahydropteroyltriglutamate--homocysteine methyltransferase
MPGYANRILTTHVGSLVRPDELLVFLRKQHEGEPYDAKAYEECLKQAVADVVRKQADIGIDIVSDGEFGKTVS